MRRSTPPRALIALVTVAGLGAATLAAGAQSQPSLGSPTAAATLAPSAGGMTLAQMPLPQVTMTAPASDTEFARMAAESNNGEILAAREALRRSRNPLVRRFAQHMIDDHTTANVGLQAATRGAGTQPAPVLAVDRDARRQIDDLRSVPGTQFDATYMLAQIPDHQKAAAAFVWETQNGRNPTLRDYATRTLPNVRMHLDMAQAFRASNGASLGDAANMTPNGSTSNNATSPSNGSTSGQNNGTSGVNPSLNQGSSSSGNTGVPLGSGTPPPLPSPAPSSSP